MGRRYAFETFLLDVDAGELKRDEKTIHLSPKVFLLLVHLIEHAGALVEKAALLDAIWPETNVSEGSLNRAVATLRGALGDDADAPRIIETVPWRGYKFIAQVSETDRFTPRPVLAHRDVEYPLRRGENVIGRGGDCDVCVRHKSVSRHHARIRVRDNGATIADCGSRNGTFVNGTHVEDEIELHNGDEIRLGSETLRFSYAAGSTVTFEIPVPRDRRS